jgi:hypothetical protein
MRPADPARGSRRRVSTGPLSPGLIFPDTLNAGAGCLPGVNDHENRLIDEAALSGRVASTAALGLAAFRPVFFLNADEAQAPAMLTDNP